jgi:hypothetical protein
VGGAGYGGRRAARRAARRLKSPPPREKTDVEIRATPSPLPSQEAGQPLLHELLLNTRPAFLLLLKVGYVLSKLHPLILS